MSSLEQLGISGVRSFDSNRLQTLKFEGPLTLIVGANGSGKTTIIECLKYITTGELPPNSKGGAFVHDPDLIAERATKAQVKLKFKSTTGATVTATRNLELQVKPKGQRSMKTLECALLVKEKNGEVTTRSTRVSELDTGIPRLLGVSKAILESVIFCHQEESLWPMSEPAPLKKRFDEIFEAQKYIKAIDHLKKMGKEKSAMIKVAENDLMHYTENKNTAVQFRKRMETLLADMGELDDKIRVLTDEAKDAETNQLAAAKAAAEFAEVIERLKTSRAQKDWLYNRLQQLKEDLQQRPETDEALQHELDRFEERLAQQQQQQDQQTDRYESVRQDISRKINEISNKKGQIGRFEGQKADHDKNIAERETAIKKSARDHEIRGYDGDLDVMQINEYMEKISRLSKDQMLRLDRLRAENERKQREAQNTLDGLRREQSLLEANRSSKKDQISSNDRRLRDAHNELERFTVDEAAIVSLEDRAKEVTAALQVAQTQHAQSNIESKQREANAKIQQLEGEEVLLLAESRKVSSNAAELAQIDLLKKNLKNTKRDLENKVNTYRDDLDGLLGSNWQVSDLERLFQKAQKDCKDKVTEAKRQYEDASREVVRMDDKIKNLQSSVDAKEKEIKKCEDIIRDKGDCDPESFEAELVQAEKNREIAQTDVDGFMFMKKFFQESIEMAQDKKACKLCRRGFDKQKDIDTVVANLKKQFSDVRQTELQTELDNYVEDLKGLQEIVPYHATLVRLRNIELPPQRAELQTITTKRAQLALNMDKEEALVAEAEEGQRDADKLSSQVQSIVNHRNEESKLEDHLNQAAAKRGLLSSTRTIGDVENDMDRVKTSLKEQRQIVAKLQVEAIQSRDQLGKLRDDLKDTEKDLGIARNQLQSKAAVNKQISDLKQSKQELRQAITGLDTDLGDLLPRLQSKEADIRCQRIDATEEERTANEQSNKLSAEVRELMQLDYSISKYIQDGGPANLAKAQRELQILENEKSAFEVKLNHVTIELNRTRDEISNQDRVKRSIVDNLNYRKTKKDFENVKQEIARLVEQNAEADQEQHLQEAHRWQEIKDAANTQRAGEMARKKEKDEQYHTIENDIEQHYKNVDQLYTRANIEVVTLTKIVKDLSTYATALNNAIMEYHGTKMEQINRIIAELWTATYQGTDIDTICIRSEHETVKSNRSYNYRVTMIKQNVEMDMRGRCSAGQRVLASIIIRLALAECFSEYCGMIALDEPTTNLDRENIRSLAESLHEIINARKSQANFQLIVITHDEDFLKVMRPSDHADNYYRVHRNQKQKSEIMQQQMFEL